jgi:FkbM family methyltransferase
LGLFAYDKLLGKAARLPLKLIPPSHVVTVKKGSLKGAKWVVGSHIHSCWLGTYEADKQKLFTEYVKPGMVVYDIGANVGFYTLLASRLVGPSGHVYAFEPLGRNVSYLERHVNLNRLSNVTIIKAAVSDVNGLARFRESHPAMGGLSAAGELEVETIQIDSQNFRIPDVMKIDVEGAEQSVLRGSIDTLRRHSPIIFLATHGLKAHHACVSLLSDSGYELTELASPDELLARRIRQFGGK